LIANLGEHTIAIHTSNKMPMNDAVGNIHYFPITKEYLLSELKDVFEYLELNTTLNSNLMLNPYNILHSRAVQEKTNKAHNRVCTL